MATNFGATVLDVMGGMELAKANQRRDQAHQMGLEDRQRAIKRDNLNMEAALFGLEDSRKQATYRDEQREKNAPLEELRKRIETNELEFKALMQPGMQKIGKAEQENKIKEIQHNQFLDFVELFEIDPHQAMLGYNKSQVLDPGFEVSGYRRSPDGKQVQFIDSKGNPTETIINMEAALKAAHARKGPGKVFEVERGKALVRQNPRTGELKEEYVRADAPKDDRLIPIPEGTTGLYNPRTGAQMPVNSGSGAGLGTGAKLDQRVAKGKDVVIKVFGGTFDSSGNLTMKPGTEQQVTRALTRLETLVKGGADPMAAAQQAIDEVQRDAALKGLTAPPGATPGTATPQAGATNWRDYLRSQEAGTPAAIQ